MFKKTKVATDDDMRVLLPRGITSAQSSKKQPLPKTPEQNFIRGFNQSQENKSSNREYQTLHFLSYLVEQCVFRPNVFGRSPDEQKMSEQINECFDEYADEFIQEVESTKRILGIYGGNLEQVYEAACNGDSFIRAMLQNEEIYGFIYSEIDSTGIERLIRLAGIMTRMKLITYFQVYESTFAVSDFEATTDITSNFIKAGAENIQKTAAAMEEKYSIHHVNLTTVLARSKANVTTKPEEVQVGLQLAELGKSLFRTVKRDRNFFYVISEHDFDDYDASFEYVFGLCVANEPQMFILCPEADNKTLEAMPFELGHMLKQKWHDIQINMMAPAMFPTFE